MSRIPKGYVHVGSVDVDAGCIWVGDPCYVIKDAGEPRPKDLGKDWHELCDRFFKRSGYNKVSLEHSGRSARRDWDWIAYAEKHFWTDPEIKPGALTEEQSAAVKALHAEWKAQYVEPPFVLPEGISDKGFANFTHDGGHGGMGLMINTQYGDGSYPVYVRYKDGRPAQVLIDFD